MSPKIEYKVLPYTDQSFEEKVIGDANIGIIRGYLAAFSKDRGNDIILKGAFQKTIGEHKQRGNRPIRMFWQHDHNQVIGGFPIDLAYEDEKGLFVEGHINLEVQKGKEAYALAKQGVISDFSVGFIPIDYEYIKEEKSSAKTFREIKTLDLFEGSLVSEPMNKDALFTEVKNYFEGQKNTEEKIFINIDMLNDKNFSKRDLEHALKSSGVLSAKACVMLASALDVIRVDSTKSEVKTIGDVSNDIETLKNIINKW